MKIFRYGFAVFFTLLFAAACVKEEPATIEFNSQEYQVLVGGKLNMMKEVVVTNSQSKPVFEVSDKELATVTPEGLLTALKAGEVSVSAHLDGLSASCKVRIVEQAADTLIINAPKALAVDSVRSVTVTVKPEGYNKENLKWEFAASDPALTFETAKVTAAEYTVKFTSFVAGGKLIITVSDNLSNKSQTAEIEAVESGIPAEKVSLNGVNIQTETLWTAVSAKVEPADYDPKFLDWSFEPTSEALGFKYEKVSDSEYKVCFSSYVRDGSVTVIVTDRLSNNMAQKTISVIAMPKDGLTSLEVSPAEMVMFLGEDPLQLQVVSEPEIYDPLLLAWTSSDEKIAIVVDGTVTPVAEGEVEIKVKDSVSKKEASCLITVVEPKDGDVRRIELDKTKLELKEDGGTVQLRAMCYDASGNEVQNFSGLEWSTEELENETGKYKVVEVSQNGLVTPLKAGTTVVTVCNKNLKSIKAICHVTVLPGDVKVNQVKLTPASKCVAPGKTFQLNAEALPVEAVDKNLVFTSADDEIATVTEEGLVTGVKKGITYIRATAKNGVYGECEVIVDDTWVEFGSEKVTLVKGEVRTLSAKVMPENIQGGTITWSSSNQDVVSVDQNGKITGLKAGESEIKVVTSKGIEGSCKVIVMNEVKVTFNLNEDVKNTGINQFESFELSVSYSGEYVPENPTWILSDPTALKLTETEGKVLVEAVYDKKIGREEGAYLVVITHKFANLEAPLEINILPAKPTKITVGALPENNVLYLGETFDFKVSIEPWQAPQDVTATGSLWFHQATNDWHGTAITPSNTGEFDIFFAAAGSTNVKTETYHFTVKKKPVDGGQLNRSELSLEEGTTARLTVTLSPANNPDYDNTLKWESSNPEVATVKDGEITAIKTGETVVTVELSSGDKLSCSVTVIPQIPSDIAIGDFYYSDGSVSHELDASKTVIGVVFSIDNPTNKGDLKLPVDCSGCTHGFVVSLAEYTTAYALDRSWARADLVDWMNRNGYPQIVDTDAACGYSNTLGMNAVNLAKIISYGDEVRVDVCDKVAEHDDAVPSPASSTGWYMPSVKELKMIHENADKVNESLSAASGTTIAKTYINEIKYSNGQVVTEEKDQYYWHSTFYSDNFYAFNMNQGKTDISTKEASELPVRIILAF